MPIIPFLANQAFEPEVVEAMSAALVATCDALGLKIGDDDDPATRFDDDPATRFVAEKVIELAQRGIRDPDMLRKMMLKEFDLVESASVNGHSFQPRV